MVKAGEFEVLQRRKGVNIRVNTKRRGDTFGEVALMFNCPRSATVAARQESVVWVLEREAFRQYVREVQESESAQLELFLNSGGCGCGWVGVRVGGGAAQRSAGMLVFSPRGGAGGEEPYPCAGACMQCPSCRPCLGTRS